MIGYVSLGSNDLDRAKAYYDALLGELGARRVMDFGSFVLWGNAPDKPMLAVCQPYDKQPATVGNGVMVALPVASREQVDALYARALELGGSDEGAPGQRADNFYAGYFRDPDGHKLNFFFTG